MRRSGSSDNKYSTQSLQLKPRDLKRITIVIILQNSDLQQKQPNRSKSQINHGGSSKSNKYKSSKKGENTSAERPRDSRRTILSRPLMPLASSKGGRSVAMESRENTRTKKRIEIPRFPGVSVVSTLLLLSLPFLFSSLLLHSKGKKKRYLQTFFFFLFCRFCSNRISLPLLFSVVFFY